MKVVLDASVAVKLVSPETGQAEAFDLLRKSSERIAPTLMMLEAANTLWKKVARGELLREQAKAGLEVIGDSITRFVDERRHAPQALDLAMAISHPVYDCVYLVVAEAENAIYVTADVKFANKLRSTRLSRLVQPLMHIS